MPNIIIDDPGLTGQFAEITYCPPDGPPLYLGYHQLPFTWVTTLYTGGTFSLYYPAFDLLCGDCTTTTSTTTLPPVCECIVFVMNAGQTSMTCIYQDCTTNDIITITTTDKLLRVCGFNPSVTNGTVTTQGPCTSIVGDYICSNECNCYKFNSEAPGEFIIAYIDCNGTYTLITPFDTYAEFCAVYAVVYAPPTISYTLDISGLCDEYGPGEFFCPVPGDCVCATIFNSDIDLAHSYDYLDCYKFNVPGNILLPGQTDVICVSNLSVVGDSEKVLVSYGDICIGETGGLGGLLYVCNTTTSTTSTTTTSSTTTTTTTIPCDCITFTNTLPSVQSGEYTNCLNNLVYLDDAIPPAEGIIPGVLQVCGSNPVTYVPEVTYTIGDPCAETSPNVFECVTTTTTITP